MWTDNAIFYQIYPLGMCGAPRDNDRVITPRIQQVAAWVPHLKQLGVDAVYFCPVFASERHGYDTRDYRIIDERLGTNADFAAVCVALHGAGIRVVLDGVFNHVGRSFWAFEDVQHQREASPYAGWFRIDWAHDNAYHDGFSYACWEGHTSLVALNHDNGALVNYLCERISDWIRDFDIDGIRLDVAYCLPEHFLRRLRTHCDAQKRDFWLVGEMIHGDYNRIASSHVLHSATNYQLYKGLWSSLNDGNFFEVAYTLREQLIGAPGHTGDGGKFATLHLLTFVDNHDLTRAASILTNKQHLRHLYALLLTLPGIPCIYYGSEWGIEGIKQDYDVEIRPAIESPVWGSITGFIARLAYLRHRESALYEGGYAPVHVAATQFVFTRTAHDTTDGDVTVALNAADESVRVPLPLHGSFIDILSGDTCHIDGGAVLAPYGISLWKTCVATAP